MQFSILSSKEKDNHRFIVMCTRYHLKYLYAQFINVKHWENLHFQFQMIMFNLHL